MSLICCCRQSLMLHLAFKVGGQVLCNRSSRGTARFLRLQCSSSERTTPSREAEKNAKIAGHQVICGVDEVGRGCIAGPVLVAAVVLPDVFNVRVRGDSKRYSESSRKKVFDEILAEPGLRYTLSSIPPSKIDEINIREATMLAITTAVDDIQADFALIDGNQTPDDLSIRAQTIIKGDEKELCIAVASIIAKVSRDQIMCDLNLQFPEYDFEKNKGYGTPSHLEAVRTFGPIVAHRYSFAPVSSMRLARPQ